MKFYSVEAGETLRRLVDVALQGFVPKSSNEALALLILGIVCQEASEGTHSVELNFAYEDGEGSVVFIYYEEDEQFRRHDFYSQKLNGLVDWNKVPLLVPPELVIGSDYHLVHRRQCFELNKEGELVVVAESSGE